ncbi:MAG: lytic murein transglycosylase [Rhodobacterales bacterium]|nr:MAG: lytic murein transglycosylase [Rhodobacterales bacterium]
MRRIILTGFAAILTASMGLAEEKPAKTPKPFADFTFKRVKPPKSGGSSRKKRITIQIDPESQLRAKPAAAKPATGAAPGAKAEPTQRYAWFWDSISPDLAKSGPGRLEPALIRISNPPGGGAVAAPRLQGLQEIARARGRDILMATIGTEVSPALVLAVIAVESGGRADAVSGAGAQGLMQLMPATAERFGVKDATEAADNIRGGVKFLDHLMKAFDRDPILVLAGYNAGEGAVRKHEGVPPFAETRDYVPRVLAAFRTARGLCKTPPELVTDGCVFHIGG